MTYQIPQQLEYKEKIMFGLTFKQLAYAFSFGLLDIIFFKVLNNWITSLIFILVSSMIGICFIFFDLEKIIKDYFVFLRFKEINVEKKQLFAFLGIRSIKNNLITNSKGKRIAILRVTPINFSIKTSEEREAIMVSFQKFLNSLDFPTQILMNTESLDLSSYLSSLKRRATGDKFANIFEKYKAFLNETVNNNKIMNRVFYLVIPEQGNISIQVNVCIERFLSLNLKVSRLKNKALYRLVAGFFQKEFIERKEEKKWWQFWIRDVRYPFMKKKDRNKKVKKSNSLSNVIEIKNEINHLETVQRVENDKEIKKFYRIISASGYPRMVEPGFLDKLVSLSGDFNMSIHINPYPIDQMLIDLNRELQKQSADLYTLRSRGIFNPSLEIQHSDTRGTLDHLQKGQERLFNISLYIICKADTLKELDTIAKKVEAELNSVMILPRSPSFRMLQGFRSILPLGIDEIKAYRNITTSALSAFFPFTSQFLQADDTGVWLGQNSNNIPIIKDIFKLSNPNGVVLSQSGGGKSYFCKLLLSRYMLNGTKVIIIDPQGEYKGLARQFDGQIIDLSRKSTTLINPLDLMGHDYTEKRLSLMDLMPVMLGDLSEPQKAFIDKALTLAYKGKGITLEPDTWNNKPPILGDLLKSLNQLVKRSTQIEIATVRSVINRLDMYVSGVFGFMNRETNIEFNNNIVSFDISNMPKQIKPAIMFLVLDYVYMKMKTDLKRKILLIDEAWSLLSRTEDASYILEIVKTCRKFNMGLLLINQEVEDLFNSRAGKSVLANSAYTMLLRQKPSVIRSISDTFHLSPSEKEHLLTASVGEGLLIMEDEHSKIKVIASPEENKLITTKADEILSQNEVTKRNSGQKDINVDLDRRFYRKRELNKDEVEYLLKEGYQSFEAKSIASGKKEDFILKPRHNESLNHMFVIYDIAEFLKKKGIEVNMYTTQKPDLVFSLNGKSHAIEVETGTVLTNKKRFLEKVSQLNKDYENNWFFVVTNRNLIKKYRKFGKTIDPRFMENAIKKLVKKRQIRLAKKAGGKPKHRRKIQRKS